MVNTLFNKVLDENEKYVFYFYFKNKWNFWPTQYISWEIRSKRFFFLLLLLLLLFPSFACRYEIIHQILFKKFVLDIGLPLHIWQKSTEHSCVSLFLNIVSHWSTCPSFHWYHGVVIFAALYQIVWVFQLCCLKKPTFCSNLFPFYIKYRVILSIFTIIILLQRQEKIPEKRVWTV